MMILGVPSTTRNYPNAPAAPALTGDCWRNIAIALIDPRNRALSTPFIASP